MLAKMSFRFQLLLVFLIFAHLFGCSEQKKSSSSETLIPSLQERVSEYTVLIDGVSLGSGIIIKRNNNNTYYVLTAKHIVGIEPNQTINIIGDCLPDECELSPNTDQYYVSIKNNSYPIKNIKLIPDIDLAVVEFESAEVYSTAKLANFTPKAHNVHLYGFKACNDGGKSELTSGYIQNKLDNLKAQRDEGYGVNYSNPSITGMSGSPVVVESDSGNDEYVVAIHGQPTEEGKNRKYDFINCPELDEKFQDNWGISTEVFSGTQIASKLKIKFSKPLIENINSNIPSNPKKKTNKKNKPPIRFCNLNKTACN